MKYNVQIEITGTLPIDVDASSEEEAEDKAYTRVWDELIGNMNIAETSTVDISETRNN